MKTYFDVAEKVFTEKSVGQQTQKARFIYYMEMRWKSTEEVKCLTGYAEEWAYRFKVGDEYVCSDHVGKEILKNLDGR